MTVLRLHPRELTHTAANDVHHHDDDVEDCDVNGDDDDDDVGDDDLSDANLLNDNEYVSSL